MQCHLTKQLMHYFSDIIRISQHFASVNMTILGVINPDVNLKRMHQLYNVTEKCKPLCSDSSLLYSYSIQILNYLLQGQ